MCGGDIGDDDDKVHFYRPIDPRLVRSDRGVKEDCGLELPQTSNLTFADARVVDCALG